MRIKRCPWSQQKALCCYQPAPLAVENSDRSALYTRQRSYLITLRVSFLNTRNSADMRLQLGRCQTTRSRIEYAVRRQGVSVLHVPVKVFLECWPFSVWWRPERPGRRADADVKTSLCGCTSLMGLCRLIIGQHVLITNIPLSVSGKLVYVTEGSSCVRD